jgi:hypothetical protein
MRWRFSRILYRRYRRRERTIAISELTYFIDGSHKPPYIVMRRVIKKN